MNKLWMGIFITLLFCGCTSPTAFSVASPAPSSTSLPAPAPTPTLLPTETPQPTSTPIIIKDLSPIYTENINQEYMDVLIRTALITDESLSVGNPSITKIFINPNFYNDKGEKAEVAIAAFISRVVFKVWWKKGDVEHKTVSTEDDYRFFMKSWSDAQKVGEIELWKKVSFSIFANDLETQGYTQEKYLIWPMYTGNQGADGAKLIREINIVFVKGARVDNITFNREVFGEGFGANVDKDKLFIYVGVPYGYEVAPNTAKLIGGQLTNIPWYLIRNTGGPVSGSYFDNELQKIIMKEVYINAYKAAFKVYPPSIEERNYNP